MTKGSMNEVKLIRVWKQAREIMAAAATHEEFAAAIATHEEVATTATHEEFATTAAHEEFAASSTCTPVRRFPSPHAPIEQSTCTPARFPSQYAPIEQSASMQRSQSPSIEVDSMINYEAIGPLRGNSLN
eukprot:c5014_g1_i1.p2 GENE.c5014_g1_i1~~c5014_g1_i1.p2  ORF type:complete len:130 (+),score=28.14 c5014_g1_i1:704-1093(+)